MTQELMANFFTLSSEHGKFKIQYYTAAPVLNKFGPKLEYSGPEGQHVFSNVAGVDGGLDILAQSVLGQQLTVLLVPTVDAQAVHLTLFLPSINLAGKKKQKFHTVAIKTTSYGMLPREGARLTYEVFHVEGTAEHVMMPLA